MRIRNYISGIFLFAIAGSLLAGCEPENFTPEGLASFSVTNAAPGSPTVDVLVDGIVTSAARLSYGNTTASVAGASSVYLPVRVGDHNIKISADTGKVNLVDVTNNFELGKAYTFVVMDTVVNNKLKVVRLTDDLTLPATGMAHVRVVHAAPATGAVDVTFVRSATDSTTVPGLSYLGNMANPDLSALSKFRPVAGASYTVKVKQAGTQTVLLQTTTNLTSGRIYSLFLRGGAKSMPLTLGGVANF